MGNNTVSFEDFEKEKRRRERQEWMEDKLDWLRDHSKEVLTVVSLAGVGVTKMYQMVRRISQHQEDMARRRDIYDHSTGMYIHCKREMTADEMLEFKRRKRNLEDPVEILNDMGLLRR